MKLKEAVEKLKIKGVPPVVFLLGEDAYFCAHVVQTVRDLLGEQGQKPIVWREWEKYDKENRLGADLAQTDLRFPIKVYFLRKADKVPVSLIDAFIEKPIKNVHLLVQFEKIPEKLQRKALLVDCGVLNERKGEVEEWLLEEAKPLGFTLHEATARFLVATYGNDLVLLRNELEKMAYLFPKREVSVGDIAPHLFTLGGISIPKLQVVLVKKDKKALLNILKEAEEDQNLIGFVGMLFMFLERWIVVRSVKAGDIKDIAQTLGKSPFMVKIDQEHSKLFRVMALWRTTRLLAKADRELKSGQPAIQTLMRVVGILCET